MIATLITATSCACGFGLFGTGFVGGLGMNVKGFGISKMIQFTLSFGFLASLAIALVTWSWHALPLSMTGLVIGVGLGVWLSWNERPTKEPIQIGPPGRNPIRCPVGDEDAREERPTLYSEQMQLKPLQLKSAPVPVSC